VNLVALACFAVMDGAFSGFRAVQGRDGRVEKRALLRAAQRRAARWSLAGLGLLLGLFGLDWATSTDPGQLLGDADALAGEILWRVVPFAALVLVTVCLTAVPSVDLQSLASVLVLGPMSLARPYVLATGVAAAWLANPRADLGLLCLLATAGLLGLERLLGRVWVGPDGRLKPDLTA
jgi:hypothetical protein